MATLGNVRGKRDLGVHFLISKEMLKMIPVVCITKECLSFRITHQIVISGCTQLPNEISDPWHFLRSASSI